MGLAPRRWAAVVAEVPFVDCITSMLDESVPLTVIEWDEWGDPRKPEEFAWMLAYAPYDNPPEGYRPPLLVTGSVNDPRVLVHEPAKWVARLRATAGPEATAPLLFRVELGAGAHVGPAGRYGHLHYEAEIQAFILGIVGSAMQQTRCRDRARPALLAGQRTHRAGLGADLAGPARRRRRPDLARRAADLPALGRRAGLARSACSGAVVGASALRTYRRRGRRDAVRRSAAAEPGCSTCWSSASWSSRSAPRSISPSRAF